MRMRRARSWNRRASREQGVVGERPRPDDAPTSVPDSSSHIRRPQCSYGERKRRWVSTRQTEITHGCTKYMAASPRDISVAPPVIRKRCLLDLACTDIRMNGYPVCFTVACGPRHAAMPVTIHAAIAAPLSSQAPPLAGVDQPSSPGLSMIKSLRCVVRSQRRQ